MKRERAGLRYQSKFLKLVKPSKRKGGAWKDPDRGKVGPDGKDSCWEGRGKGEPEPLASAKHLLDGSLPFHHTGSTNKNRGDPSSERLS